MKHEIKVKRIYEEPSEDDGCRILVDRLWPRGVSKAVARIDQWPKHLTPSSELRKWFHSDITRYDEFAEKYEAELQSQHVEIERLLQSLNQPTLTLVTSTKVIERGHVTILKRFLDRLIGASTHTPTN